MEKKDPIQEAQRYVDNAITSLTEKAELDYQEILEKRDRKLLTYVNDGYNIMHLSMGYDGIQKKSICQEGIRIANEIIERCRKMINGNRIQDEKKPS